MLRYPWIPYSTIYYDDSPGNDLVNRGLATRQEALDLVNPYLEFAIDFSLISQVNDVIILTVQNSLTHTANTKYSIFSKCQNSRYLLPEDDTLRFLIAFLYEKQLGFLKLSQDAKAAIFYDSSKQLFFLPRSFDLDTPMNTWNKRAVQITQEMKRLETNSNMAILAGYPEFVRDSALVQLGEKIGVEIQTSNSPITLKVLDNNGVPHYPVIPANQKVYASRILGINNTGLSADQTYPVTLTGKNGASLISSYSGESYVSRTKNPDYLLQKDGTYLLTYSLMRHGVTSTIVPAPTVLKQLNPTSSVQVYVTESVDLRGLFGGDRLTITATSSNTDRVTVQVNQAQTSLGVVARSIGTAQIRITAVNPSGSATETFGVTTTPAVGK